MPEEQAQQPKETLAKCFFKPRASSICHSKADIDEKTS
jgi:hypothetical protein